MNNNDQKQLAISVRNVGVAYRQKAGMFRSKKYWALKDISFDLFHGETLGIIGRNGVGKSTLLRLLTGIISPDKGSFINHGVTASLLSLQLGFVPYLTGRENVILSGMMLGLSKSQILNKMDEIQIYADVGVFFDQPVQVYSSGMRSRVGFSIAIYTDADVILLDEVLGVGDTDFRKKSAKTMRDMIKSNKTIVLVSHSMKLIQEICDRVIFIDDGTSLETGNPSYIIEKYIEK
ncbi:MAG: ABC transporter ATP-binding protein [Methylophagaceae bacterium]